MVERLKAHNSEVFVEESTDMFVNADGRLSQAMAGSKAWPLLWGTPPFCTAARVDVYVTPATPYDVLLTCDFLTTMGAVIDMQNNTVEVTRHLDTGIRDRVRVPLNIAVPGGTEVSSHLDILDTSGSPPTTSVRDAPVPLAAFSPPLPVRDLDRLLSFPSLTSSLRLPPEGPDLLLLPAFPPAGICCLGVP
jgi:hypothetical protein